MKKQMKKVLIMLAAVAVMFTMMPDTAEAASKKTITVTASGAKISSSKFSITATGTSQLTVKYAGKKVTSKATYKSSNTKVATVSKKGKITAKKKGSCTITVKYSGKTKKLKLSVTSPTITVKAGGTKVTKLSMNTGASKQLSLILGYKNSGAKKVTSKTIKASSVKWKSSNTAVATVSTAGKLVARKAGTTTITMTYGTVSKKITVTVKAVNNGNSSGNSGSTSGATTSNATTHQHTWKARTATTRTWVTDIREKTVAAVICRGCGEIIPIDEDSPELIAASNQHAMNHALKGEPAGGTLVHTTIEVDYSRNVEAGEVYYYCDCGAESTSRY